MFCKKCGKDIDVDNKVCPYCGEETDFLPGIDGGGKPHHLANFEKEINRAFNERRTKRRDEDEYQDISSYQTKKSQRDYVLEDNTYNERPTGAERRVRRSSKRKNDDEYKTSSSYKIIAAACCIVIVVCLIIIMAVSCGNGDGGDTATTTAPATAATTQSVTEEPSTEATTTQPAKSVDEYLQDAVVDDSAAIETAQGFYSNIETACAGDDIETFKSFFSSSYTDAEIQEIYNNNHAVAAGLAEFIPGYTQTISCEKYIYVYIAATTNSSTGDYVENTFVLSSDGGAFKLDKSQAATEWLAKAPTKLS